MKILLLGASGQLGQAFLSELDTQTDQVTACSRAALDITDAAALEAQLSKSRPEVTINCTAYTDVQASEQDSNAALAVNATAVEQLAHQCFEVGSQLVHFSTDYVFDGHQNHPYVESDPPNPLNQYGRTKLMGEQALMASQAHWLLIRSSWVYGLGERNFISKLRMWSQKQSILRVVNDEISVPTSADDLAHFTLESVRAGVSGLFHLVNNGSASRYELARAIQSFDPTIQSEIVPAKLSEFESGLQRPAYSVLDNSKFTQTLGRPLPHWTDALKRFLASNEAS